MSITTSFTEMFGVDHPIMVGGMTGVGTADFVAAIAQTGALPFLTALTQPTPNHLSAEIERCRAMTDRPFGVNLTVLPTRLPVNHQAYLDAALDAGVRIIETAGRSPEPFLPTIRQAGARVIHKAVSVRHALSAERLGVDAIAIDGFECAGHPGDDDIGGLVLIRAAARRLRTPIIASGGIADGQGMAAALALGACAVNMGTRFVATVEAGVHQHVKERLVAADERSTTLIMRSVHNTARVLTNAVSTEVVEREDGGGRFEDIAPLVSGARSREKVLEGGEVEDGLLWAGQSVGLVEDIPTCAELVNRTLAEAQAQIERLAGYADQASREVAEA